LAVLPRLFIETVGFFIIAAVLTYIVWADTISFQSILPQMAAFVLAMYRLLPSINRIVSGYNEVNYYHRGLEIVSDDLLLTSERLFDNNISFKESIEFNSIFFNYSDTSPVLENVNLKINKGERVAIIGETGCGKSTLLDLLMGLYKPNKGDILVDKAELDISSMQKWRQSIGYVPQNIYLFSGSVKDNIIFGKKFDAIKMDKVIRIAQLDDFLKGRDGIMTQVGENGINLSGGQKQRISIARALYGDIQILILDEATSALDQKIEKKIMNNIYKLDKNMTVIIVAHRLNTIENCDSVYRIEKKHTIKIR
jgi:ABC-type multidrug transport system fused ATPase/permease subunit